MQLLDGLDELFRKGINGALFSFVAQQSVIAERRVRFRQRDLVRHHQHADVLQD